MMNQIPKGLAEKPLTPDWVKEPSPIDIRAARQAAKLSQSAAGRLCHRALRTWQDAEAGLRRLDPAAWELFLLRTGQHPTHRLVAGRADGAPGGDDTEGEEPAMSREHALELARKRRRSAP